MNNLPKPNLDGMVVRLKEAFEQALGDSADAFGLSFEITSFKFSGDLDNDLEIEGSGSSKKTGQDYRYTARGYVTRYADSDMDILNPMTITYMKAIPKQ